VAFVLAGGRKIDYVLPVPLGPERDNGVHLMLKYYKHQTGSTFRYGGHESDGEADPIRLERHRTCEDDVRRARVLFARWQ
jgi:hypothetical protein